MEAIVAIAAAVIGVAGGFSYEKYQNKKKLTHAAVQAEKIVDEARKVAKDIEQQAKRDETERRSQLMATERQLLARQENLDQKLDDLDKRQVKQRQHEAELELLKDELRGIRQKQETNLEKIAGLSKQEAREKLMQMTERDTREDMVKLVQKLQTETREEADDRAREILAVAMERMASDQSAERTVTTVPLPSDELKGRVIGKEGRNIQASIPSAAR